MDEHLFGLDKAPSSNSAASVSAFKKRSRKAKAFIDTFLGDSAIAKTGDIIDDDDAPTHKLWIPLSELFTESSSQVVQNLMQKKLPCRCSGQSCDKHVSRFMELVEELDAVDLPMSDRC